MTALLPTARDLAHVAAWVGAVLGAAALLAGYLGLIDWLVGRLRRTR